MSTAQLSIPDSQSLGSGGSPPPQPTDLDLREELRKLRNLILAQSHEVERLARLVETNVGIKTRLDMQLDDVATTVTSSLSTLSSASQSLVTQCQSFLTSQASDHSSFLREHSAQLTSLYARSNSTESRDLQLQNMMRAFTTTLTQNNTAAARAESFRLTVEENTRQLGQAIELLRPTGIHSPTPPHPTAFETPIVAPTLQPLEPLTFDLPTTPTATTTTAPTDLPSTSPILPSSPAHTQDLAYLATTSSPSISSSSSDGTTTSPLKTQTDTTAVASDRCPRLSPRGLSASDLKISSTRQRAQPNHSQSTLSFASKRSSTRLKEKSKA